MDYVRFFRVDEVIKYVLLCNYLYRVHVDDFLEACVDFWLKTGRNCDEMSARFA